MQLIFSRTSPYVRKVMVLAHETGVIDQFEIVESGDLSAVTMNETVVARESDWKDSQRWCWTKTRQ